MGGGNFRSGGGHNMGTRSYSGGGRQSGQAFRSGATCSASAEATAIVRIAVDTGMRIGAVAAISCTQPPSGPTATMRTATVASG